MQVLTILRRFHAISLAVLLTLGTGVAVLASGDGSHPGSDVAPAGRFDEAPPAHANDDQAPPAHANDDEAPPAHANDDGAPPAHANNDAAPPAHANNEASDKQHGDGASEQSSQREIKGIPDDNPNFDLDRGSGADAADCDRGDTDIKITPSGVRVNVPCHTAEHQGLALGHENAHGRGATNHD